MVTLYDLNKLNNDLNKPLHHPHLQQQKLYESKIITHSDVKSRLSCKNIPKLMNIQIKCKMK